MIDDAEQMPEEATVPAKSRRRWPIVLGLIAGVVALALAYVWLTKEDIARDVIADQLAQLGLPATYRIESIGTDKEVLSHIVIGDPKRPDLTIERAEVALSLGFGGASIGKITLVRPRLYGSYRAGKLSFGSLDKMLFTGSKEPFRLPDYDLSIEDGRGLMETDFGDVGLKLEGGGRLRDGFSGVLAAIAPQGVAGGCKIDRPSLFGKISVASERPKFDGILRVSALDCAAQNLRLAGAVLPLNVTLDQHLDGAEGQLSGELGALALGQNRIAQSGGPVHFVYRQNDLTARFNLAGKAITTPQASAAAIKSEGVLRSHDNFARIDAEGTLVGISVGLAGGLDATLANWQHSAQATLAAPLLGQMRSALQREARGSAGNASFVLHKTGEQYSLVVPQGSLRGGSGASLFALSRFQMSAGAGQTPLFSGNFSTGGGGGGAGLPQIAGRMERRAGNGLMLRMTMADYRAGTASLAMPELMVAQSANGAIGFAGSARLSGDLPGGRASNLVLPLSGNWSSSAGLSVWRQCTPVRFDSLTLANLTLERRDITLCPTPGGAILRADGAGLRIAAGAAALNVTGRLGTTPIRIASGPAGFAMPGVMAARSLDITLGNTDSATHFKVAELKANIGKDIAGRFIGTDVFLNAVPLDIFAAEGDWRYADGRLEITGGAFRLEDRQLDDRFKPLIAHDGVLTLADSKITASATMREPRSDREITRAVIRHDLNNGRGHADLAMDGITFDNGLQPDTLSALTLGVIANAKGVVRGAGQIDWNPDKVTSTGRFSTDSLDFAAAFGPVKGASGTVIFTDLLGLITAPDQRLKIASINPGIEANDGELSFELRPDSVLQVNGAHWPFLDGRLSLEPTRMVLGAAETRRYVLKIEGLDAAKFLQRMELANLSAQGIFDGTLPLVFDENGGRIEGGLLISRPPGGNVSYVGELTYKDMGAMANYAFNALRSLDYTQMRIAMDGALEGEIETRLRFSGVKQGAGAQQGFVTRQLRGLPIQFNVNLRAPFYQLITSFKAMYDPAYIRDPRDLGLIDKAGKAIKRTPSVSPPAIQPPDSETKP